MNVADLPSQIRQHVRVVGECWEWTGYRNDGGYGQLALNRKTRLVHRVTYELAHGPLPRGLLACHRCDNRACVNPAHLFAGTHRDNSADCVAKGRQTRLAGASNGRSKLTPADVVAIRSATGVTQRALAQKYGVTQKAIWKVQNDKAWSDSTSHGHQQISPQPAGAALPGDHKGDRGAALSAGVRAEEQGQPEIQREVDVPVSGEPGPSRR